ncbi:hypothetical protein A3D03_06015 [Candidatus Gottesmanbacteria bacterium RIFCSPHIGHO2_02_FULL_40_13]|uniref:Uncharacterized protein n=1 Tax=Candidatus Gottesmanbacteria bacterium RIFCSPHIGHO2_02_FULL_40_13 TaxID=1798384 RepID=A0A1F6A761_9BACT|nr:MAG: hypothetical protein A3D03_06015 [Candidatus Gottesmanbacteria bacterium RIFCSPHIGHO2_02_FULL_40_13]
MSRFVDPDGHNWIGLHSHDGKGEGGLEHAKIAHKFASHMAIIKGVEYHEVSDDLGEPCTIMPNYYDPELRPARIEKLGW